MDFESMIKDVVQEVIQPLADKIEDLENRLADARPQVPKREWWKPSEVATRFGLKDNQTVRGWCKAGKIEAVKDSYSDHWLIPQAQVERLDASGGRPEPAGTYLVAT